MSGSTIINNLNHRTFKDLRRGWLLYLKAEQSERKDVSGAVDLAITHLSP
jgi:hypothetical protein